MLGTPIEPGERDVDVVVELLQECQRTAREAAASDLTDEPWDATRLRGRVIDLLERGGRALAVLEGTDANQWSAITWTEATRRWCSPGRSPSSIKDSRLLPPPAVRTTCS
jgi:hypothetical protein